MKKRLFTVLTVFAALALTACGGKKACKTHSWGTWSETKAATCMAAGSEERVCKKCGQKQTRDIEKLAHDFTEWTDTANSTVCEQEQTRHCQNTGCVVVETQRKNLLIHNWEVQGEPVAAGNGGVSYYFVKCSACNKQGLMVDCANATFSNPDNLKTAPENCYKLGSDGHTMTLAINLAEQKSGKLYMHGTMDYWYTESNQNEQKGIYDGKGAASKTDGVANFKIETGTDPNNLTQVALTASKDLLYKDFIPDQTPGFTGVSSTNWSKIGDVEVGDVTFAAGLNTIKFTRVDSYNLAIKSFLLVF